MGSPKMLCKKEELRIYASIKNEKENMMEEEGEEQENEEEEEEEEGEEG